MTDVFLFHHAQGVTEGVRSFADELRAAGHAVAVPDFYDGRTFATLDDGMAYAGDLGFDQILQRNLSRQALDPCVAALARVGLSGRVRC